jgi:hypothetical protein
MVSPGSREGEGGTLNCDPVMGTIGHITINVDNNLIVD